MHDSHRRRAPVAYSWHKENHRGSEQVGRRSAASTPRSDWVTGSGWCSAGGLRRCPYILTPLDCTSTTYFILFRCLYLVFLTTRSIRLNQNARSLAHAINDRPVMSTRVISIYPMSEPVVMKSLTLGLVKALRKQTQPNSVNTNTTPNVKNSKQLTMSVSTVGATSQSAPSSWPSASCTNEYSLGSAVMMNGTGLVVCAVCGFPVSGLTICALPWSAVMSRMHPAS
jgi:hypothetical protein